ncbi:MAG: STAS domain-containing protein [Cyclobacteriaceae bacterium]|nr:STAS domain-containing protein [Cyclobacteriaceae bacterium]
MTYTSEIKEGILVVNLTGDLIGEDNGFTLLELVNDTISNKIIKCVINISDLRYINSSGIGVLITVLTKFRNKGGEVYLVKPSESVKKLLIITKLNAIFNVSEKIEEAILKLKEVS